MKVLWGSMIFAGSFAAFQLSASAQTVGPSAFYIDPMHTSWPICDGAINDGLDIATPLGTPVTASMAGNVMDASIDTEHGCGLKVEIKNDDGSIVGYGWLSYALVKTGDAVKPGQAIAFTGQSGNATAPKLHWTLFTTAGEKVDARGYLASKRQTVKLESIADPEVLRRSIDFINASDEPDYLKRDTIKYVISQHEQAKRIVDEEYAARLHQAIDAWYANNKNWRKIPNGLWSTLTERDRGRLKDGIDPETLIAPAAARRPAAQ